MSIFKGDALRYELHTSVYYMDSIGLSKIGESVVKRLGIGDAQINVNNVTDTISIIFLKADGIPMDYIMTAVTDSLWNYLMEIKARGILSAEASMDLSELLMDKVNCVTMYNATCTRVSKNTWELTIRL